MGYPEAKPPLAALMAGDVVDALRCLVDRGASIQDFEYTAAAAGQKATLLIPRTPRAVEVLGTLAALGLVALVSEVPAAQLRRSVRTPRARN